MDPVLALCKRKPSQGRPVRSQQGLHECKAPASVSLSGACRGARRAALRQVGAQASSRTLDGSVRRSDRHGAGTSEAAVVGGEDL